VIRVSGKGSGTVSIAGLACYRPGEPGLNPVEGVWANMKNGLGNLTARTPDQLAATVRSRLARIQHRPDLITGSPDRPASPSNPEPP
jgi:transposase